MILDEVATFLAAQGQGIYDPAGNTGNIFTHAMQPATLTAGDGGVPQAAMSIEVYGYAPDGPYTLDSVLPAWENPRLHIMTRDPDATTCFARCYAAWKALIGLSDVSLGGVQYFRVRSVHGPLGLGRDDNNLWLYAADVQAQKVLS